MSSSRGPIKLLEPCEGDPWWGFTSWCGGSCSIHTPWWNLSIHYPKSWAGKRWFPNLVKLMWCTDATVGYKRYTAKKRYKHVEPK